MTLRERLRNINPFIKKKELDTTNSGWSTTNNHIAGTLSIAGNRDKIFEVFSACGLDYDKIDPYTQRSLSRMMYAIFPFVKRAINDISGMVGNIKITGDMSEDEIAMLNDLAQKLPILSEFDWINSHEQGFNNLVKRITKTTLIDGMCFVESRFSKGEYIGELLFDSENFTYERFSHLDPYKLIYQINQFPDVESGLFKILGYDFNNAHPYASPLVAGGGFFTHILIAMLVALKNTNIRKGAPVELGVLAVKESEELDKDPSKKANLKAALNDMSADLEVAAKNQLDGIPTNIVAKMPVDMSLMTKAFGAEMIDEIDNDLLQTVLVQIMNLLEVPPDFFGVVLGSSGFSGERFRVLYKIWSGKIDDLREKIKPVITKILFNYFLDSGVDARLVQRMDFEFVNVAIMDDKEVSETNKLNAETDKIYMEVAAMLAADDSESAKRYLEEKGLL